MQTGHREQQARLTSHSNEKVVIKKAGSQLLKSLEMLGMLFRESRISGESNHIKRSGNEKVPLDSPADFKKRPFEFSTRKDSKIERKY